MKDPYRFADVVRNHLDHLTCSRAEARQHIEAWLIPTPREKAIKRGIEAYAAICDAYSAGSGVSLEIGGDFFFRGHARAMVDTLRGFLRHQSVGRLDVDSLDTLIVRLAIASHTMDD